MYAGQLDKGQSIGLAGRETAATMGRKGVSICTPITLMLQLSHTTFFGDCSRMIFPTFYLRRKLKEADAEQDEYFVKMCKKARKNFLPSCFVECRFFTVSAFKG